MSNAFISVPKPMRPLKTTSITMTRTLISRVTVPKLSEVVPEIPSASVFQALVPAEPACTPNTLPTEKQASPSAHSKKRLIYSFLMLSCIPLILLSAKGTDRIHVTASSVNPFHSSLPVNLNSRRVGMIILPIDDPVKEFF